LVDACENVSKAYDAAGRLVREGSKTYRYGYLDKVMSVTDNGSTYTYEYHADGQLARANYGHANVNRGTVGRDDPIAPTSEDFLWDGLALIQRGDEQFINEPHVGGGNPVASSKGTSYFNDALGTTVGAKKDGKYSAAVLSAFGEGTDADKAFFTGKPMVEGLGHAFLMRNYRAGLAKWQSADPMGYPDGWNQLAYCNNGVSSAVDVLGAHTSHILSERHFVDLAFYYDEFLYTAAWLGCQCNGNYYNPVLTPYFYATFGADAMSTSIVLQDDYGNDVVYEALLEIDYYMGVSKPIITPTAVGDDKFVELFVVVDVVVRLTSPSLEFDEIEIAHKVYKDLHFGETFEKPIFEE